MPQDISQDEGLIVLDAGELLSLVRILDEKAYGPHEIEENDDGQRKAKRTFVLEATSIYADGPRVLRDARIPRIGDVWATAATIDNGLICVNRHAVRSPESPILWDATCDYSSHPRPTGFPAKNPLDRPAEIEYRFETVTEALQRALDTNYNRFNVPIANSAGLPYDPPLEVEQGRLVITIKKNMASYDPIYARGFLYRTNLTEWWGFEPNSALMTDFSAKKDRQDVLEFWPTQWVVKINEETWIRQILDAGTEELSGAFFAGFFGSATQPIIDNQGQRATKPQLLNGAGHVLAPGADPVFNSFRVYRRAEFNDLHLP